MVILDVVDNFRIIIRCGFEIWGIPIPVNIWSSESGIFANMMKNDIQECFGVLSK